MSRIRCKETSFFHGLYAIVIVHFAFAQFKQFHKSFRCSRHTLYMQGVTLPPRCLTYSSRLFQSTLPHGEWRQLLLSTFIRLQEHRKPTEIRTFSISWELSVIPSPEENGRLATTVKPIVTDRRVLGAGILRGTPMMKTLIDNWSHLWYVTWRKTYCLTWRNNVL